MLLEKRKVRSALPIYVAAAAFALYARGSALYTGKAFLWAVIWCALSYVLSERLFFKGRMVDVETKVDTGDRDIDKQIAEGRSRLKQIRDSQGSDETLNKQIDRMYDSGMKIFEAVAQKPEKAQQVRKFMNYYLPTAAKLMEHYHTLSAVGGKGEHVTKALSDVRNNMVMIADAFEKQLDNLYRAEAMDVSSDIDVMEAMIAGDGLTDAGVRTIVEEDKPNG